MATDVERLVVSLEANIKKYEREMERSRGVAEKALREVERSVSTSTAKIEGLMARTGGAIRAGLAGALAGISLAKVSEFADSFTKIQNQLKISGLEGAKLDQTFKSLFDIAQKQGAPLDALATLYGRVSGAQKELKTNSGEMLQFTNAVALALKVNGTSATEASGALLQLGQALGGGKIQAEEFNSLIDGARPLLQAAAAGIKEAGGSVASLTALVKDGKVSSEAFFRGVLAGLPVLDDLASKAKDTTSIALARLNNSMLLLVGAFDQSTGASDTAATAISRFAGNVDDLTSRVPGAITMLKQLAAQAASTANTFGNLPVFKSLADRFVDPEAVKALEKSMNKAEGSAPKNIFDEYDFINRNASAGSLAGKAAELRAKAGVVTTPIVKPISLADFKVPGEKEKKEGGGGGGGGGGKSSAEKVTDYKRETDAIEKRTRAFDSERESLGKSALDIAQTEGKFRLMEAAAKANVPVTEQLTQDVDRLSLAYAKAKVALDEAEEKQRQFQSASRQVGATLSDSFKDAILEGEKLTVVLDRLLKSFASRGIDSVFDSLFAKDGAGTGLLKTVLGAGFASGGYTGPGRMNDPRGVVHAGEVVWSQADIRRAGGVGTVEAMRRGARGYAAGGVVGMAPLAPMNPGRITSARRASSRPAIRMGDVNINAPGADRQGLLALKAYVDAGMQENRRTIGQQLSNWKEDN